MTDAIRPGTRATIEHVFTRADIATFAHLSGDLNPIHLDGDAARAAGFREEIVHGVLVCSLISRLLGTRLPGPGTIFLAQTLTYRRPVYPEEAVRATVEVISVRQDKPVIVLQTWAETDDVVLEGEATVLKRTVDRAEDQ
jgi:3-hydroxybutyryl-CoA dehydratase